MTPPVISYLTVFLEFLTKDKLFYGFKTTIWNTLYTILIKNGLDEEIIFDNIQCQLQIHLMVLNHLKNPQVKKKKNLRVTFEEEKETFYPPIPSFNESYRIDLENFVIAVLQFYLNKTSYPEVGHLYANQVCQVILVFKNYDIDKKLCLTLPVINNEISSSTFRLYKNYFKMWINDDKILTYNSISVIIGLLESIENVEEQLIIIKDLNLVIILFM